MKADFINITNLKTGEVSQYQKSCVYKVCREFPKIKIEISLRGEFGTSYVSIVRAPKCGINLVEHMLRFYDVWMQVLEFDLNEYGIEEDWLEINCSDIVDFFKKC